MNTLLLIAAICYNAGIQQSDRHERVNARAGLSIKHGRGADV